MLLGYARAGNFRLDISQEILSETMGVMRERFHRDPYSINDARQKLEALCQLVTSTQTLNVIKEDPDDHRILECAITAKSDYIVTEDKDLLRLGRYGAIEIINIADFVQIQAKAQGR